MTPPSLEHDPLLPDLTWECSRHLPDLFTPSPHSKLLHRNSASDIEILADQAYLLLPSHTFLDYHDEAR